MKLLTALILMLPLVGCDKPTAETQEATATQVEAPATTAQEVPAEPAKKEPAALATVEVAAKGTVFDPPVKPEQIPAGAWYCDMGTVEYASLEKGDGKCPKCGMMLKQKPAVDGQPAADGQPAEGGDHDGHD